MTIHRSRIRAGSDTIPSSERPLDGLFLHRMASSFARTGMGDCAGTPRGAAAMRPLEDHQVIASAATLFLDTRSSRDGSSLVARKKECGWRWQSSGEKELDP